MRSRLIRLLARIGLAPRLSVLDPVSRALDRQEREARRRHKAVRPIQQAKRQRMHEALRGRA